MLVDHPFNEVTSKIIKCAIEVHRHLGPGLLESACLACLIHELLAAGLEVVSGVKVPLRYKGVEIDCSYKLDLLVNDIVIIELKAVEQVLPIHKAQLLTYLKLTGRPVGALDPVQRAGAERRREPGSEHRQERVLRPDGRRPSAGVVGGRESTNANGI